VSILVAAAAVVHHHGEGIFFPLLHWLAIHTGTVNEPGDYYGFFSGFGSDLGEYTVVAVLLAGLVHTFKRHNCREHKCWRIGIHTFADKDGQVHPVCRRHHPTMPPKEHHIHFADMHRHKLQSIEKTSPGGKLAP
jgi:hypothetical protein